MKHFEYGIIGAGPAGATCATALAKEGKSVVLFEKEYIGGTCLNKGCIPTKTFLHAASFLNELENSEDLGISSVCTKIDFEKVLERKNNVILTLRRQMEMTLKAAKVHVVMGEANIEKENLITANNENFECENIVVATGAKPRDIKGLERDGKFILNSDDILNLSHLPKSVLIVGSGAIGLEWRRIFSSFKVDVTLLELAEHILPVADVEVSKRLERRLKSQNVKFFTKTSVERIENKKVYLSNGEIIEPEIVFVAIGRELVKPKIKGKVTFLGDVSGTIQLAHFASHQAMEYAKGIKFNKGLVPSVIYGAPEIAWVGKREQDLKPNTYKKVSLPITALGKAYCDNSTDGFMKILVQNDKIVGAHIFSNYASAIIHEVLIAIHHKVKIEELKEVCFAHPTYSEGVYEALMRL